MVSRKKAEHGVAEPDWKLLLKAPAERKVAAAHWEQIVAEMSERETLSPLNAHAVQRLILAYLLFDRCSLAMAEEGVVTPPQKDNPKSIPRLSVHFHAMKAAAADAERLEAQLGLSPQRRNKVAKVTKKTRRNVGADAFLNAGT